MRLVLRLLVLVAALLLAVGAPAPPAEAAGNPDAIDDCTSGFGACQHYLRAPGGITADPCFCDRCREYSQHDGSTVPDGMNPSCFTSQRVDCYLKRHSVAWHLACSECAQKVKCCSTAHPENCPDCDGDADPLANDDMGRPARATALQRLTAEKRLFKKPDGVVVVYNRHFYVVTDIGGVKVKMKGGSSKVFTTHEYAHLMLERAEMARKEFIQNFGDQLKLSKPVGIYLPEKERDAGSIQANYFGSQKTNQLYGGSDKGSVSDGFCFNGFCCSAQKFGGDDDLHFAMRHMIGHSLISCWVVVDGNNRALPRWLFEGVGHWLSRYQDRFKDDATFCSDEGPQRSTSGKGWLADCAGIAADPRSDSIEKLFGKTAIGQLSFDDQKRAWSYLDLCLREWREPFVAMLADLRQQKEVRDAFMSHLQVTPEGFDDRWKARVTGRRRSMSPKADEDEPTGNDTPGARERRSLRNETDPATLAAKIRALGTVDDPKTMDVLLDQFAKNTELVRSTAMVAVLKVQSQECQERIWNYGLAHQDGNVRAYSAHACGKLKLEFAAQKLRAMIPDDKFWLARAEAAIACGELKDANAMSAMRKLVNSDPAEKTQLAMMDALALFGEDAQMSVPLILKQLDSAQWQLRVAACQALGKIGSMEAVETLVTRMEQETGRVREEIRDALKAITYDDLGMKPENWRAWWDRLKANTPNGIPGRPEKPKEAKKAAEDDPHATHDGSPKYYGIEIYSSRIGFVLDTSLSMDAFFEPDPRIASALSREYKGATKLAICKEEISQTLRTLDPRSHFSIIAFNTRIVTFKKNPVPSSAGNISSAQGWLQSLPPAGETNYYGGLRAALDLDEGPDDSQNFRSTPDTLTFLTDGMPTQGEITDADTLSEWYTALNRYARIRTHVIAFGTKGVDLVLLRAMAERNGGKFVCVTEREP